MTEQQVKDIFKTISKKYESSNLIISLGLEKYWRARFSSLIKGDEARILDACCGTGNSTFALWEKTERKAEIHGLDFSAEMLEVARDKIKIAAIKNEKPVTDKVSFIKSDISSIPFKDDYFDLVTIVFGIRNVIDRKKALSELYRVTIPGGKILVMEFNMPTNNLLKKIYILYMNKILINLGTLVTNNREAYRHLVQSIIDFPQVDRFVKLMKVAGWKKIINLSMSFNTCVIYEAYKLKGTRTIKNY